MKQVQTFLIEEVSDFIHDSEKLTEWNSLVEKLNLGGQSKLVQSTKSPIPFVFMNTSMINVFETLCPKKETIENFDVTPIPTEILQLVALSKKEGYFNKIEIWYDEKTPDPVCVGLKGYYYQPSWYNSSKKEYNDLRFDTYDEAVQAGVATSAISFYAEKKYLLGKWGDENKPFETLKEIAIKRYISDKKNEYEKELEVYKRKIQDLNQDAYKIFN